MVGYLNFYSTKGEYGCFSNFSRHPITIDNKIWPTSEHYFQAMKFHPHSPDDVEEVRKATTPSEAARLGRKRSKPLHPNWENIKDDIMRTALRHKFTQHEDIKKTLLSTNNLHLIEHTYRDSYWADGGCNWSVNSPNNKGKNMLGVLLTELRESLKE